MVMLQVEENGSCSEVEKALEVGARSQVEAKGLQLGVRLDGQCRVLTNSECARLDLKNQESEFKHLSHLPIFLGFLGSTAIISASTVVITQEVSR
jgi:hypothetical protein